MDSKLNIKSMANKYKVTERTIRYDVEEINLFFLNKNLPVYFGIKDGNISVISNQNDKAKAIKLVKGIDVNSCEYALSPKERKYLILKELFFAKDFVIINHLANNLHVCRNTIINDLERVKNWLRKNGIEAVFIPSKGLSIDSEERTIRKAILELYREALPLQLYIGLTQDNTYYKSSSINYPNILLNSLFKTPTIKKVQNYIDILQKELNIIFADLVYIDLIICLATSIQRIKLGHNIYLSEKEKVELYHTDVYEQVQLMFNKLSESLNIKTREEEVIYFSQLVLASNTVTTPVIKDYNNSLEGKVFTNKLIAEVGKRLNNDLSKDDGLYHDLFRFVLPFIYRQKYNIQVNNPYLEEIKLNYPKTFIIVKSSLQNMEQDIRGSINEREIGYITLYFAAALEKQNEFNVLLLSGTGYSIANLLSTKLKAMFNINVVDMGPISEAQNLLNKHKVDLIVSTSDFFSIDIPCIVVNPLLTQEDILNIKNHIDELRIKKLNLID